jgi:FimV-like protein
MAHNDYHGPPRRETPSSALRFARGARGRGAPRRVHRVDVVDRPIEQRHERGVRGVGGLARGREARDVDAPRLARLREDAREVGRAVDALQREQRAERRADLLDLAHDGAADRLARPAAALELDKLDLSFDPDKATFEDPTPSVLDGQWHDAATKLDLAKAYQEMGDVEGAREILQEVLHEGDDQQKAEAKSLLAKLG